MRRAHPELVSVCDGVLDAGAPWSIDVAGMSDGLAGSICAIDEFDLVEASDNSRPNAMVRARCETKQDVDLLTCRRGVGGALDSYR